MLAAGAKAGRLAAGGKALESRNPQSPFAADGLSMTCCCIALVTFK